MQLVALGGGSAWPNAGQGCSSYLVRHETSEIVIDCGPDTLLELRKHTDMTQLAGIVISHLHSDHIIELVAYRYGLHYGPGRAANVGNNPIPLWLPPGGINLLASLASALKMSAEDPDEYWSSVFDLHEYEPDDRVQIGPYSLTFHPTQHFVPCNAIRVSVGDDRDLVYTADTGEIESLVSYVAGAKLLICEGNAVDQTDVPLDERGHLTPEDAGELARRADVPALVLTHLWAERPTSEVMSRARAHYGGAISVARPGAMFDV